MKTYTFTFRIGNVSQPFDYECESVSLYDAVNQFAAFASLYAKSKGSDVSYFRSHYSVSSARSLGQSRLLPQKHRSFLKFSFGF